MDIRQESLKLHYDWNGKIEVISRVPISNSEELALAYTPGVAEPCLHPTAPRIPKAANSKKAALRYWTLSAAI